MRRPVGVAVLASLSAGLVAGILARLAMRILALAGGTSDNFPELRFTVAGTIEVLSVPMLQGIPFVLLLLGLRRFLPGTGWRKPLSYGLAFLVFPGLLLLTDSEFHAGPVNRYLGRALFAPIYFLYGLLAGIVIERFVSSRRLHPPAA